MWSPFLRGRQWYLVPCVTTALQWSLSMLIRLICDYFTIISILPLQQTLSPKEPEINHPRVPSTWYSAWTYGGTQSTLVEWMNEDWLQKVGTAESFTDVWFNVSALANHPALWLPSAVFTDHTDPHPETWKPAFKWLRPCTLLYFLTLDFFFFN